MSKNAQRLKLIVNLLTIFALAVLVFVSRKQVAAAFNEIADLHASILLFIIPLQIVNFYCTAQAYRNFYLLQGEKLSLRLLYKISLELNFVNTVFPSGGVSGFSYLGLRMRHYNVTVAKSTLAHLMRFIMMYISFLILMFVGMFMLAISQHNSSLIILFCSTITFLIIFGTIAMVYIISDVKRITAFTSFLPKVANRFIRIVGRSRRDAINITKVEKLFSDFHQDYVALSGKWGQLRTPLLWSIGTHVTEVMSIYCVYIAFGSFINPGALVIGYAAANFAGVIAVLPGGVGVYEGLMTAVLASAGINQALALSATVVYRVCNMALLLPTGYFFYHRALRQRQPEDAGKITFEHGKSTIIEKPKTKHGTNKDSSLDRS
jgi:uncharacterized protein (TIRG00374 family)